MLNKNEIVELLEQQSGPCVSLFQPTHRKGPEVNQDSIHFRNLIDQATKQLGDQGVRSPDARELLSEAARLKDDDQFWAHQDLGLACFAAPGMFKTITLPTEVEVACHVGDRFHIRPLLGALSYSGRFYFLSVEQKNFRLFSCDAATMSEIDLPDRDETVESLSPDRRTDSDLQYHSTQSPQHGAGDQPTYHGHDRDDQKHEADLRRYLGEVDRQVTKVLRDASAPLVVECVDYLKPIYDSVNTYPNLLQEHVARNPGDWSEDTVREKAWRIARNALEAPRAKALERFEAGISNQLTSTEIEDILIAAADGRVEALFLRPDAQASGSFDPQGRKVRTDTSTGTSTDTGADTGSSDLVDLAAAYTLRNGGSAYVLENGAMPQDSNIAALYRYAVPEPAAR